MTCTAAHPASYSQFLWSGMLVWLTALPAPKSMASRQVLAAIYLDRRGAALKAAITPDDLFELVVMKHAGVVVQRLLWSSVQFTLSISNLYAFGPELTIVVTGIHSEFGALTGRRSTIWWTKLPKGTCPVFSTY